MRKQIVQLICITLLLLTFCGCTFRLPEQLITQTAETDEAPELTEFDLNYVLAYSGVPYCEINKNRPFFTEQELTTECYEFFSPLDELERCGVCMGCLSTELMPTEKRGSIGSIKPTGWQLSRYDGIVDGNYLFNRCHLIAYSLSGQNANTQNLITGTRYFNIEGMLPFETMTANYINRTGNHVLYRITPIFEGENLLATGVLMEAYSVEDAGEGLQFNVFCYNVQPQIVIDYATGENWLEESEEEIIPDRGIILLPEPDETAPVIERELPQEPVTDADYILNTKSRKFHKPDCTSVADIQPHNREDYSGEREALIAEGYQPCQKCKP